MTRRLLAAFCLLSLIAPLGACVVQPAPVVAVRPACHWVPGHWGAWGWVPARCV